jgi:V/A-type H+/Na+-transporting ATPase subunit I
MIVPMKRITLVCVAREREATLETLRELGVLHLAPAAAPTGGEPEAARMALAEAEALLRLVRAHAPADSAAPPAATGEPEALFDQAGAIQERLRARREEREALRAEYAAIEPFGRFDPAAVRILATAGIRVRLLRLPANGAPELPDDALTVVTRADRTGRHVALIAFQPDGKDPADGAEDAPDPLEAYTVPLPARSLDAVETALAGNDRAIAAEEAALAALAGRAADMERRLADLRDRVTFADARAGMGDAVELAYLEGFCPETRLDALHTAAREHGWGLVADTPGPDDIVPTLIRHPAWVKPLKPLLAFLGILPGYREIDPSAAFLVFMTVFFAMIVGDAGYGAIFLALTLWAARRNKRAPREPFRLLALFSAATIAWGVLTGNYFGIERLPSPLRLARIDWLLDQQNSMDLCLLIGAVHLSLAHGWSALSRLNSLSAVAQLGWIGITWTMFLAARFLLLGVALPAWFPYLPLASVLAVILFMTPWRRMKQDWAGHAMLPLNIISNFGDLVSYLRLFALGVAGVKVAQAFNDMALMIGFSNIAAGFFAATVLFLGHTLNIILCGMSVLVHGVRLNALEFSLHMGLEWSGVRYRPFAKNA